MYLSHRKLELISHRCGSSINDSALAIKNQSSHGFHILENLSFSAYIICFLSMIIYGKFCYVSFRFHLLYTMKKKSASHLHRLMGSPAHDFAVYAYKIRNAVISAGDSGFAYRAACQRKHLLCLTDSCSVQVILK